MKKLFAIFFFGSFLIATKAFLFGSGGGVNGRGCNCATASPCAALCVSSASLCGRAQFCGESVPQYAQPFSEGYSGHFQVRGLGSYVQAERAGKNQLTQQGLFPAQFKQNYQQGFSQQTSVLQQQQAGSYLQQLPLQQQQQYQSQQHVQNALKQHQYQQHFKIALHQISQKENEEEHEVNASQQQEAYLKKKKNTVNLQPVVPRQQQNQAKFLQSQTFVQQTVQTTHHNNSILTSTAQQEPAPVADSKIPRVGMTTATHTGQSVIKQQSVIASSIDNGEDNAYDDNESQLKPQTTAEKTGNKVKTLAALNLEKPTLKPIAEGKCNSEAMQKLIFENIDEKPTNAKRHIQKILAAELGGKIDVICSSGVFSYYVNTELYCEVEKYGVTCLAFRQSD